MKNFILLAIFLLGNAIYCSDFHSEKIFTKNERIYVISSFEEVDYLSVFSFEGEVFWEIPFASRISSWKFENNQMFIFSGSRDGRNFYLTDVDLETGAIKWENRIQSPLPIDRANMQIENG